MPQSPPQTRPLFIVGAADEACAALASALWSCAGRGQPGLAGGVTDDLDAAFASADTRVLALVQHPVEAVAAALAQRQATAAALQRWVESARRLLRAAHRGDARTLLVRGAEARASPQALARALADWHPAYTAATADVATEVAALAAAGADQVLEALAHLAVPPGGEALRLFDELLASCVPLGHEFPAAPVDVDAAVQAYQRARSAEDEGRRQLAAAQDTLRQRDRTLAELRGDAELQELLLRQAHEEIDSVRAQLAACERVAMAGGGFRAARMEVGAVEDRPPHRHVDLRLQQLRVGTLDLPALQLRLLEHHGRPGVALFQGDGAGALLSAWQATDSDGGTPVMLLVPDDVAGRERLSRLGTSDWLHLRALVDGLPLWLGEQPAPAGAAWAAVAARLSGRLAALPPRLRYDALQVEHDDTGPGVLLVTLHNTLFGDQRLGAVRLRWSLGTGDVALLLGAEAQALPMSPWPLDAQGRLAPMAPLPLGTQTDAAAKRRQWSALADTDRLVVLGLVDALAAVPTQAPGVLWRPTLQPAAAAAAAAALQADVRQTFAAMRRRRLARRLLGRARPGG